MPWTPSFQNVSIVMQTFTVGDAQLRLYMSRKRACIFFISIHYSASSTIQLHYLKLQTWISPHLPTAQRTAFNSLCGMFMERHSLPMTFPLSLLSQYKKTALHPTLSRTRPNSVKSARQVVLRPLSAKPLSSSPLRCQMTMTTMTPKTLPPTFLPTMANSDERKAELKEHAEMDVFRRFLAQAAGRSALTKLDFRERERSTRTVKEMADAAVAHSERVNREAAVLARMAVAPAQSVTASVRSTPTPGARATALSSAATTSRGVQKRRRRRRNQGWVRHSWAGWR
jgi:hypothetical protein